MPCTLIAQISGSECIGDSRKKINDNFLNLETVVCILSNDPIIAGDTDSIGLTFDAESRQLTGDLIPGAIHTQTQVYSLSGSDELLLWRDPITSDPTLNKITVENLRNSLNISSQNYFRATETYPNNTTDTDMKVTSIYINQVGNPTGATGELSSKNANIWRRLGNYNIEHPAETFALVKKINDNDNGTYIELQPGVYDIHANAGLQKCETHVAALISFDPNVAIDFNNITTLAVGTIQYNEIGGQHASNYSVVGGRFTLTQTTGVALFHAFQNAGTSAMVGTTFRHWTSTIDSNLLQIMPRGVTASIDIYKLA